MTVYKQKEIQQWADSKGIYEEGDFMAQMKGVAEEVVETTEAYIYNEISQVSWQDELEKELGDIYVFWINACYIADVNPSDAVDAAYNKIINRTGEMIDGRFVKDKQ